jgi:transcriptional regulator with XRE-family HTH domain
MKVAREATGVSRRAFARQLYMSHSNLADYENGHRLAPPHVVESYERELGLPVGSLLELWEKARIELFGEMGDRRRPWVPPAQTVAPERAQRGFRYPQIGQSAYPDQSEFEGRVRDAFWKRVWLQRIVKGLEVSLRQATEMRLGLHNTPELVRLSLSTTEAGDEVPSIDVAYYQAGGQLVIVGPPGSGKTTEALKLMRHLLEAARDDVSAPVPEIFPLDSWAKERKPILDWLADELQRRHGWPPDAGASLIRNHSVVPFLDGLDEVAPAHRTECLRQINRFWDAHRGGPLVLCSRRAEYEELHERAKLGGAVTICPPDANQIDAYLAAAGPQWEPVREKLRCGSDPILSELLTTPLMLSVAVLAYQDEHPETLSGHDDLPGRRDRLWSQYVSSMRTRSYEPRVADQSDVQIPYTEEQATRWLGWLAKEMASRNETELWLHEWSGPTYFQKGVKIALGVVLALGLGLTTGLSGNLNLRGGLSFGLGALIATGLTFGSNMGLAPNHARPPDRRALAFGLAVGLAVALVVGLLDGTVVWLAVRLAWGLAFGLAFLLNIGPAPTYRRPFDRRALAFGSLLGLVFGVGMELAFGRRIGLAAGLALGLAFVLAFGLIGVGLERDRVIAGSPRQIISSSSRLGFLFGLLAAVIGGLAFGAAWALARGLAVGLAHGSAAGLTFGLAAGLAFGLDSVVFHCAFRLWLRTHDLGPWDWPGFLDWASDRLLLRTNGASYQWIHRQLRDYLAER